MGSHVDNRLIFFLFSRGGDGRGGEGRGKGISYIFLDIPTIIYSVY